MATIKLQRYGVETEHTPIFYAMEEDTLVVNRENGEEYLVQKETEAGESIHSLLALGMLIPQTPNGQGIGITQDEKVKLSRLLIDSIFDTKKTTEDIEKNKQAFEALGLKVVNGVLESTQDIEVPDQVISGDPAIAGVDNRLITVANVFESEFQMLEMIDEKTLKVRSEITDVNQIILSGVYSGDYIHGAPALGKSTILAVRAASGAYVYWHVTEDGLIHTGTRGSGQATIEWWENIHTRPPEGIVEISTSFGSRYLVVELDTFSSSATHNLLDGKEHTVVFKLKMGQDWAATIDRDAWYLTGTERGSIIGLGGFVSPYNIRKITESANKVTIKYNGTRKELLITKVDGGSRIDSSTPVLTDGTNQMDSNYIATEDNDIATIATIREFRHTVVMDIARHGKATRAEAIKAFKRLPHYEWTMDDQFYIKDVTGKRMLSMKYFADKSGTPGVIGRFFYRAMTECI